MANEPMDETEARSPDLTEEEIMALFAHGPGLKKRAPVEILTGEETISELGRRLRRIRERIEASGESLLTDEEIEREVAERRWH